MADNITVLDSIGATKTLATKDNADVHAMAHALVDETGTAFGVQNINGKLRCSSSDYKLDIAKGDVPGQSAVRRFGLNSAVGTSIETIGPVGGLAEYPVTAGKLTISSDSGDDEGPLGIGARTITVQGLDSAYAMQSEDLDMDGTFFETVNTYIRVFKVRVTSVGSAGTNVGTISIKNSAETVEYLKMLPGEGASVSSPFTVPAGQTFYMTSWDASEASSTGAQVTLWQRTEASGVWELARVQQVYNNNFYIHFDMPLVFAAKTDIEVRAVSSLGAAVVSGGFSGWRE